MAREIRESGPRSWFDSVAGAAQLWMQPGNWPELVAGQTRRILVVALCVITTATALLLRATVQVPGALTAGPRHPLTSAWLGVVVLGIACAAPIPPVRARVFARLVAAAARTFAGPALVVLAEFAIAHSGVLDRPTAAVRIAIVAGYWLTLTYLGLSGCAFVARAAHVVRMPGTSRLRLGLFLVGAGLGLAACQLVGAAPHAGAILAACGISVLAAAAITASRDLRGDQLP